MIMPWYSYSTCSQCSLVDHESPYVLLAIKKNVKGKKKINTEEKSLHHVDKVTKFLDLNSLWSCKHGRKKWQKLHLWLSCAWLHSRTKQKPFLPSFHNANGCLCQERLLRFRTFATMATWPHTSHLHSVYLLLKEFEQNKTAAHKSKLISITTPSWTWQYFFPFLLSLFWGRVSLFSWHRDRPFLVSMNHDVLKNCSVNCDWSALCETWTAKIFNCLHAHWRSIKENKLLIWPNDLNYHLVAWFNFTFESFDVTSHFSALRPTYSWLPLGIYSRAAFFMMFVRL